MRKRRKGQNFEGRVSYLEGIGGGFELDLELHHGGGPAGPDDGGEGADGGDGLSQVGLIPPAVELIDDGEGFLAVAIREGGGGWWRRWLWWVDGGGGGGGLGLGEPVGGDGAEVRHPCLVVCRNLWVRHWRSRRGREDRWFQCGVVLVLLGVEDDDDALHCTASTPWFYCG